MGTDTGWELVAEAGARNFGEDGEAATDAYLAETAAGRPSGLFRDGMAMAACGTCGATGEVHWSWDDPEAGCIMPARAGCPECLGLRVL